MSSSQSSPHPKASPHSYKRTRRWQLWMKHSFSSPQADFEEEQVRTSQEEQSRSRRRLSSDVSFDDANHPSCVLSPLPVPSCPNIDTALLALSCAPTHPTAAYQVSLEEDWMLDGTEERRRDQETSQYYLQKLDIKLPETEEQVRQLLLQQHNLQYESQVEMKPVTEEEEDDFGDFQSAPLEEEASHTEEDEICENEMCSKDSLEPEAPLPLSSEESLSIPTSPSPASTFKEKESHTEEDEICENEIHSKDSSETEKEGQSEEDETCKNEIHSEHSSETGATLPEPHASLTITTSLSPSTGTAPNPRSSPQKESLFSTTPLYRTLPLSDVSTPQGRFARRLQLEGDTPPLEGTTSQEEKASASSNPGWQDINDDKDAVLEVLEAISWQHVPLLQSHPSMDDICIVQEELLERLSGADALFHQVQSLTLQQIATHTHELESANVEVQQLQHNLDMCALYMGRTRDSLEGARGSEEGTGLVGYQTVLDNFQRRETTRRVHGVVEKCGELIQKEGALRERLETFQVGGDSAGILAMAQDVQDRALRDEDLCRLECLHDLRHRASTVLDTFQGRIESVTRAYVSRVCLSWRSFDSVEYESLVRAVHQVQERRPRENATCSHDTEAGQLDNLASAWSQCLLETLVYHAEKCLARALLDPTDAGDSEYDKDLIQLGLELLKENSDRAKLLSLTHNLVTIRFDFESNQNYLPMVYHRLCALLTDVLHVHCMLMDWHSCERNDIKEQSQILYHLKEARAVLWKTCEDVLIKCLDRYLHTSGTKRALFRQDSPNDESIWREDLECMHDLLRLTQQFLSLRSEFLEADGMASQGELYDKLGEVFGKHLRSVHVEAMNSLGAALYNESWRLIGLGSFYVENVDASDPKKAIQKRVLSAIKSQSPFLSEDHSVQGKRPRYWQNQVQKRIDVPSSHFSSYETEGNPFLGLSEPDTEESQVDELSSNSFLSQQSDESRNGSHQKNCAKERGQASSGEIPDLYSFLASLVEQDGDVLPPVATEALVSGLLKWTARLLSVAKKLPLITDDVCLVLKNLCNLYFTTSFRLCSGSAAWERIMFGIDCPSSFVPEERMASPRPTMHRKQSSGSMLSGFGRRQKQAKFQKKRTHEPIVLPVNLEADLCAPLSSEMNDAALVGDFIREGQEDLEDIVNLQKIEQWFQDPLMTRQTLPVSETETLSKVALILEKRQGAAWSCLLVAVVLDVILPFVNNTVALGLLEIRADEDGSLASGERDLRDSDRCARDAFEAYAKAAARIAPALVQLCSRISCVRASMGKPIVQEVLIAGSVWEESGLNEHSNPYIDDLCDRLILLWKLLAKSQNRLPSCVLSATYEDLVQGAYLALLEGFSRVRFCSTEGRSLMSMDISSFSAGIDPESIIDQFDDSCLPPARVRSKRGMQYVNEYIKVFYYPEGDVLNWIAMNHSRYQLNHSLALLACKSYEPQGNDEKRIANLLSTVRKLYENGGCNEGAAFERRI